MMTSQKALTTLLDALKANGSSATFFITGQYFNEHRRMVDTIRESGFEVGYHGHTHEKITSREVFLAEIEKSRVFLETFKPIGFRAPWIYLPDEVLGMLPEFGFQYDSSTFAPPGTRFDRNGLTIFPVTSLQYFGMNNDAVYPKSAQMGMLKHEFPIGSGIFVSLLRKFYPRYLNYCRQRNKSIVFYLHDWQLAPLAGKRFTLFKDKLRYVHNFPIIDTLLEWVERQRFANLSSRLTNHATEEKQDIKHYLTIDIEHLEHS